MTDDAKPSRPFGHKCPPVRQESDAPGVLESRGEAFDQRILAADLQRFRRDGADGKKSGKQTRGKAHDGKSHALHMGAVRPHVSRKFWYGSRHAEPE
jgi:hypothetical protein